MSMPILAHDDVGEGARVVLFVHAFPVDRRMWRAQVEDVRREGARAIAVDLAGFGASRANAPMTIDDHADSLAATLKERSVERAVLVGLSMGGYVALAFARRHPAMLAGLLLADTKATADSDEARTARQANIERARREGVEAVFDAMLPKLSKRSMRAKVVAELRAMAREQSVDGVVAALSAMRDRPDATADLDAIAVPTRVVVGVDDGVTSIADAQAIASRIRGAKLVEIDGAGHFANVDNPLGFAAPLHELLRT